MAGGLAALLDDIAAIARVAAASVDDISAAAGKASAKAAGVVIDDTAVTPQYVRGFKPNRELPIIWRIAKGSLLNKAIIIVIVMLLSQFIPWILTPLLMVGGAYLCFEGAEKLWEWVSGHHPDKETPVAAQGADHEKTMVSNAIRTDFILSAEIMVISLNEIAAEGFWLRLAALVTVAILITALVYGVVALIVKMDDIGLAMAERDSEQSQRTGRMLVNAMPKVLAVLSVVGTIAMLWVGGHILLVGMDELGFHPIYEFVHMLEVPVAAIPGVGPVLGWLVNTLMSAILGVIIGGIIVVIIHLLPFGKDKHADDAAVPADH
ncbi:DUF808 domain-containing protein [Parenemella sanctibonifatiensis]|uniref:ABC transporter n=1 Tax=Parenemella sanctibonifatiensis TaxID=2016505 RepID=A0A255ECV3_9ACTN|nr:DUF808 domain-containing protein [Parenemella sanctibonifatiensis]OYN88056.1 ABC transporter [Parenemella sanctibonifatiensis]OYN89388.1 ABC transporter [Parenemella sanctibonifatiensis]